MVVGVLLVATVVWLVRRPLRSKAASDGLGWSMQRDGQGSSEDYKEVELH